MYQLNEQDDSKVMKANQKKLESKNDLEETSLAPGISLEEALEKSGAHGISLK